MSPKHIHSSRARAGLNLNLYFDSPNYKLGLHFFLAFLNFVVYSTGWILIKTGRGFSQQSLLTNGIYKD